MPLMPVEEEGRLTEPIVRDSFVTVLYGYNRWQSLCDEGLTPAGLIDFHTRHELLLLSHSEAHRRRLGRLLAEAGTWDMDTLSQEYIEGLMDGLKCRATRRRQ